MNYVYKNITTTNPTYLLRGDRSGLTTVDKLQIANVTSSDASVDIYIEKVNIDATVSKHGTEENGNFSNGDWVSKVSNIYYHVKNVVIPQGVTLILFTDPHCTYDASYDLRITSTQNVDVIMSYNIKQEQINSRSINQY